MYSFFVIDNGNTKFESFSLLSPYTYRVIVDEAESQVLVKMELAGLLLLNNAATCMPSLEVGWERR
jgi:hypothetical protein